MIHIRKIDPNSENEIRMVAERMRNTLIDVLGKKQGENLYSMEWLIDRVYWHLSSEQDAIILLAESNNDAIIGQAIARVEKSESGESYGYFSTIYVVPEYRRQGVARHLINSIELWCNSKRLPYVVYNTAENNDKIIKLFESFFYRTTEKVSEMVQLRKLLI